MAELTTGFTAGDTIILQATNDITFMIDTTLQNGVNLVAQAGNNVTVDDTVTVAAGTTGNLHFEADTPHNGGSDGAGAVVLAGTGTVSTASGNITLIGDDFTISGTASVTSSGGGNVNIVSTDSDATNGADTIDIGSGILDGAEIARITTAGTVTIGQATSAGTDGLGTGAELLTAESLTIDAALTVAGATAGTFELLANDGITITDVDVTVNGLFTANADVDNAGAGTFTITNDTTNGNLILSGATNSITADLLDVTDADGPTIAAAGGALTIIDANDQGIGLGDAAVGFDISKTDLANITAAGTTLTFQTTAGITVENLATGDFTGSTGTLILDASGGAGQILFDTAGSALPNDWNLTLNSAAGGIDVDTGTGITLGGAGGLDINATGGTILVDAVIAAGSGGVNIDPPATVDINAGINTTGNIVIEATGDITIDATVETTGAATTVAITADQELDDTGDVTIGGAATAIVRAVGGNVTLTGNTVTLADGTTSTLSTTGAGNIIINADAMDDGADGDVVIGADTTLTIGGGITIDNAINVDLDRDVVATTGVTISNVVAEIDIAQGVNLTANGGNLDLDGGVNLIDLSGGAGINTLSASAEVQLGALSDSGTPAELQIDAGTNVVLDTISIANLLDINVDTGGDGSSTLMTNQLSAGTITVDGQGTNDTFTFSGSGDATDGTLGVESTTGDVTINLANEVNLDDDVTGAMGVTVSNVNTVLDLGGNVDVTASGGNLDLNNSVTLIDLEGGGGTVNILSASAEVQLDPLSDSGTPDELQVDAGTNVVLDTISIANLLDINVDTGGDGSSTLTTNQLSAGTITVDGQGTNDTFTFSGNGDATDGTLGVESTTGDVTINLANEVNLDDDVTGAMGVTVSNVNTVLDLGGNVDVTASGGNLDLNNSVTLIDLEGGGGTVNILSASAEVQLDPLSDSGTPDELQVDAGTNVVLDTISIANLLDINVDTGGDGSSTLTTNQLSAGTITVDGQGTNDTFTFSGNGDATDGTLGVESTTGDVTINLANEVNLDDDVTGAMGVTVSNVNTVLDLGGNVDVTASGGNLDLNNSVTLIDLEGGGGTVNILSASAEVQLDPLSDSGTPDELQVDAGTNVVLDTISIANLLDINVDTGGDGSSTLTTNQLSAGTITVDGQGTNDTFTFSGNGDATDGTLGVESTTGDVTINLANEVNLDDDVTGAMGVTVSNVNTVLDLGGNVDVTASGGNLDLNNSVTLIDLARTIHEFGKKEGLRCVRKTLLQALSHTQEAFTWETIPHDSL